MLVKGQWIEYGSALGYPSFEAFAVEQFNFYQFQNFLTFARSLGSWNSLMGRLQKRLETDKSFDIKTCGLSGFEGRSMGWGKTVNGLGWFLKKVSPFKVSTGKSRFHKFIDQEKERVDKELQATAERRSWELKREALQKAEDEQNALRRAYASALEEKRTAQERWRENARAQEMEQKKISDELLSQALEEPEVYSDNLHDDWDKNYSFFSDYTLTGDEHTAATAFEEALYAARDAGLASDFERSLKRVQAFQKSLEEHGASYEKNYELAQAAAWHLSRLSVSHNEFMHVQGTHLQHQLQEEIVDVVNRTSSLVEVYGDNDHITSFGTLIYYSAAGAITCIRDNHLQQAAAISDWCFKLFELGRSYTGLVAHGFDAGARAVVEGVGRGFVANAVNIKKCLTDPSEAAQAVINALGGAVLALGRVLLFTLSNSQVARDVVCEVPGAVATYMKENTAPEIISDGVAFAVELLGSNILWGGLQRTLLSKLPSLNKLCAFVNKEQELAKSMGTVNKEAAHIISPVTTMLEEAGEIAKAGVKKEFADIAVHTSHIVVSEHGLKEALELLAHNQEFIPKTVIHICVGEFFKPTEGPFTKKLVSGLHTLKALEDFIKTGGFNPADFEIKFLSNGVIQVKLPEFAFKNTKIGENALAFLSNGTKIDKIKTLWPVTYDQSKLLEEARYIIGDPQNKIKNRLFIGQTQGGIKAMVGLDHNNKILTTYPLWEQ